MKLTRLDTLFTHRCVQCRVSVVCSILAVFQEHGLIPSPSSSDTQVPSHCEVQRYLGANFQRSWFPHKHPAG